VYRSPEEVLATIGVEDGPEHAQAVAMFALKRKSGHAECSPLCSGFEVRMHTMWVTPQD
jgi:hypothetical protein